MRFKPIQEYNPTDGIQREVLPHVLRFMPEQKQEAHEDQCDDDYVMRFLDQERYPD